MEVEENDANLLKKKCDSPDSCLKASRQGESKDHCDSPNTKDGLCNGDAVNANGTASDVSDNVIENGIGSKDSDVNSNSSLGSKTVHLKSTLQESNNGVFDDSLESKDQMKKGRHEESMVDDGEKADDHGGNSKSSSERNSIHDRFDDVRSEEKAIAQKADVEGVSEGVSGKSEDLKLDEESSAQKNDGKEQIVDETERNEEKLADKSWEEKSVDKNDSEKENESKQAPKNNSSKFSKLSDVKDSASDDVEFMGESKLVQIDSPSMPNNSAQNVILLTSGMNNHFSSSPSPLSSPSNFGLGLQSPISPGYILNGARGNSPSPMSLIQGSNAPPKPKSSLDQIELIRWEIQNRLNTRPKYFKPNPSAELGPLAKFLFDIGSNLIKEAVYHELVKIQSRKNEENTLSEKEKEDLEKLKDIERELHSTIGHLKLKMKKRCKVCHFQTEFSNVLYHHKQFPHEDNKNLHCAHCPFVTKQPMTFKFHIESEHSIQPRLHDKKSFFECDLCPYENNQEQKLTIHKQRCTKQFRPLFNLHPSCLSGAEINLCLENIFYKPIVPKNLKLLQQKHAQQQAALAEARRQQAEVQALAAQKNAAALAAKKRPVTPTPQRFNPPTPQQFSNRPQGPTMPSVRYNSRSPAQPVRPTVANMLKDKHSRPSAQFSPAQNNAPGGFEVCEICGGYVKDRKALRIHFFYAHRIDLPFNLFDRNQPPLYCATCYVRFWTAQGLRKHIDIHVQEKKVPDGFMGEGVHGKCISCSQLVGNIVVHMRVVHNREIHHYINALMCMFCGASFNSRPNVERHITDVHGTIDIATGAVKVKARLKSSPQASRQSNNPKKTSGSKDNLVKGSVCVLCNLNFGRNVDLTRHCMRMHHTCMKCGMVVIDKASLLKHTCLSSPSGTRDCTMCAETGFHPAYYVKHLRDKHLRKFSITVARVSHPIIEKWIKRPYPFKSAQDELVEISDSEDEVAPVEVSTPPAKQPVSAQGATDSGVPQKKPRIGPASKIGRQRLSAEDKEETKSPQDLSSPSGSSKRKMSVESTPERMSKRRK